MSKKKNAFEEKAGIKDIIADALGASREVLLDLPKLTLIGNRELTVENYKSIGEYSENKILLNSNPYKLKICGSGLEIKSIATELIYICGRIAAVEFKREV